MKIPSLHGGSCASTVTRHVKRLGGVSEVTVATESKLVDLTYNESKVTLDRIRESLDEIGYFAED